MRHLNMNALTVDNDGEIGKFDSDAKQDNIYMVNRGYNECIPF